MSSRIYPSADAGKELLLHGCPDCPRNFRDLHVLFEHLTREEHTETSCGYCVRHFGTRLALLQHYDSDGCWRLGWHRINHMVQHYDNSGRIINNSISEAPRPEIVTEQFLSPEKGLTQGKQETAPKMVIYQGPEVCGEMRPQVSGERDYPTICTCKDCLPHDCPGCDRSFGGSDMLFKHLKEEKHTGTSCRYCAQDFNIRSALIQHYESDGCWGYGREAVKNMVRQSSNGSHVFNDGVSEAPPRELATLESFATEIGRFICPLCPARKQGFGTLVALNEHIRSPKHDAPKYRCTNKNCNIQFKTLGAVHQHSETKSCLPYSERAKMWASMAVRAEGYSYAGGVAAIPAATQAKIEAMPGVVIYQEKELREMGEHQISEKQDKSSTDDEAEEVGKPGVLGVMYGAISRVSRLWRRPPGSGV